MSSKTIHMIWFQGLEHMENKFPYLYDDYLHTVTCAKQSGWNVKLWTTEDADLAISDAEARLGIAAGSLRVHYDAAPSFSVKSDVLRHCIMFVHGGIYLDADAFLMSPDFDWIVSNSQGLDIIAGYTPVGYKIVSKLIGIPEINTHFFWCPAGSKVIRALLTRAANKTPFGSQGCFTNSPIKFALELIGPAPFNRLIQQVAQAHPNRVRLVPGFSVDPFHMSISPTAIRFDDNRIKIIDYMRKRCPTAVVVHRGTGTWIDGRKTLEYGRSTIQYIRTASYDIVIAIVLILLASLIAFFVYKGTRFATTQLKRLRVGGIKAKFLPN